jgi:phosphoglycerol transferase MdoB-like AlkP superfamily enzyme
MTEIELLEPENLIRTLTLLVTVAVVLVTALAYYRTRLNRVLVLALLAALLATDLLLEVGEELFEEGIPYFELFSSLFTLGIAILLLLTVVWRFDWQPR